MAKAKRLAPKAPQHTVRLDLTMEEAKTLKAMLRATGGNPTKSRRKRADKMLRVLEPLVSTVPDNEHHGSVVFHTPDEMGSRF